MFKETLKTVVDGTEGGLAGLLMGYDGIAIDQYTAATDTQDVETVGMELSVILKGIRTAAEMLATGDAREVAIRAERVTTVIRLLNEEYFVAVTVAPGGNPGKAGYLLRIQTPKLLEALS